ncbi:MAG: heme-degrading domain-containing protein [Rhizobiaceae bacterium]|nr:heme-degrading domain-containing protein [Rhizobiaceae bacterium]
MSAADIARIMEQEEALVFDRFDEAIAFDIGSKLHARAVAEKLPVVIEVRFWDRLLFYAAMPGSTASNANWVRRKMNTVQMFQRSTYRIALEQGSADKLFKPDYGLDPADYVLAGGGFPIRVKGTGVVGAIGLSGLPQRQDHEVIVGTVAAYLGHDVAKLALGPEA